MFAFVILVSNAAHEKLRDAAYKYKCVQYIAENVQVTYNLSVSAES